MELNLSLIEESILTKHATHPLERAGIIRGVSTLNFDLRAQLVSTSVRISSVMAEAE